MRYINPYRLFSISIQQADSLNDLEVKNLHNSAYKYLLKHQPKESFQISGTKITYEELETLLEEWGDKNARAYHIVVFKHRMLLNFLEYSHPGIFNEDAQLPQANDDFWNFLQPYFFFQFGEHLDQAVRGNKLDQIQEIALYHKRFPRSYYHLMQSQATDKLGYAIEELKELQNNPSLAHMSEREIISHLSDSRIAFYNQLPDFFEVVRNDIAVEAHNTALLLGQRLGRLDGAKALAQQALKLQMDSRVQEALSQLVKKSKISLRIPLWAIIGVGIIVLLFVIQYLENNLF